MVENTITDNFTNFNFSGGDFFSTLIFQGMAYFVKFLIHEITYEMFNKIYDFILLSIRSFQNLFDPN